MTLISIFTRMTQRHPLHYVSRCFYAKHIGMWEIEMIWIQWITGDGESQNIWIKLAVWIHQDFSHCQIVTINSNFLVQCNEDIKYEKKLKWNWKKSGFAPDMKFKINSNSKRHIKLFHSTRVIPLYGKIFVVLFEHIQRVLSFNPWQPYVFPRRAGISL